MFLTVHCACQNNQHGKACQKHKTLLWMPIRAMGSLLHVLLAAANPISDISVQRVECCTWLGHLCRLRQEHSPTSVAVSNRQNNGFKIVEMSHSLPGCLANSVALAPLLPRKTSYWCWYFCWSTRCLMLLYVYMSKSIQRRVIRASPRMASGWLWKQGVCYCFVGKVRSIQQIPQVLFVWMVKGPI